MRLWGVVGYGSGSLRLELEDRRVMDTDLTMTMGALGVRGALLQVAEAGGFELALRSDVLWMAMDSAAAADNLAATEAGTSRVRVALVGSRPVVLEGGGSFTPSLELGLRHDGGDAETGSGVEVGGSLRYASAWGLSIEASVRGLLAHEAQDYREWGAGGALRYDPGRQGMGLTASVMPTWGTAGSGVERLWGQPGGAALEMPGGHGARCGGAPGRGAGLRAGGAARPRAADALRAGGADGGGGPGVAPGGAAGGSGVAEPEPGGEPAGGGGRGGGARRGPAGDAGILEDAASCASGGPPRPSSTPDARGSAVCSVSRDGACCRPACTARWTTCCRSWRRPIPS